MFGTCRHFVFVTFAWLVAQQAGALSLEQARARAVADNPGLAQMRARYESLAEVAPQRGSLPDPMLSIAAANFPWDDFDRNQEPMTQLQLGISQKFPFPGKRALAREAALFEAETALTSVEETRLQLEKDVAVTWWRLYYLDRSLETVRRNQALLRQFVEVARTKYEVGKGLQQDVLLAQLELSGLLDRAIRVEAMRADSAIALNLFMGADPDEPVALERGEIDTLRPLAPQATLYSRAAAARPLLDGRRSAIRASESRLALAEKDYYPDFTVGVTYGQRDEDELGLSRQDFLSVKLSVSVPLYAGTRQDRQVAQRQRELARSHHALNDERNRVLAAIASMATDYRRASEQLQLFDRGIIPQARQTMESMLAGYQVDEVDFLNLVRAQVTLLRYELQYWQSFTEAKQSVARLVAAVGGGDVHE
ncbi:MAG: TolC family protein [Halioglobus sp.]|nr:TolC family protein [Halioglobus sp.]